MWRALVDLGTPLVGLATALSIIVSAIFNFSYFWTLGFLGAEMLTVGDLLMTAFRWLPATVPAVFSVMIQRVIEPQRVELDSQSQAGVSLVDRIFAIVAVTFMLSALVLAILLSTNK